LKEIHMEALLVLPLVVIVAICAYVIWRGLRKPPAPQPAPDDEASLSPGSGGNPR
jgi:hypothetical protein